MFFVEMTSMAATEGAEVHKLLSVLLKFSQRGRRDLGQEFLTRYPALRGKISGIDRNTFFWIRSQKFVNLEPDPSCFTRLTLKKWLKKNNLFYSLRKFVYKEKKERESNSELGR